MLNRIGFHPLCLACHCSGNDVPRGFGLAAGVVWGPCWSFWRVFTKKMLSRGVPWLSRGVPWHGAWSRGPVVPWSTGRAQANWHTCLQLPGSTVDAIDCWLLG